MLEYIKYEIRKFSIRFSKENAKKTRTEIVTLEDKLKELEQNPDCIFDCNYLDYKNKLEQLYEEKANNSGKMRSKCEWCEFGEKSSKFFLDLEKQHALLNQVRTLLCGEKEVTDKHKINEGRDCFYKNLVTEKSEFQKGDIYLSQINIPILTEEQSKTCEGPVTESDLLNALESMPNNKSSGNDGLTKELYETFWEEIKRSLCNSMTKSYKNGELGTSQKQALIKLIEQKDKGKKLIKNWRSISLLNVDTKLISKVIAERIKTVLPSLISKDQTAYVKRKFFSVGDRLISDILEISDNLKIKGF